MTQQAASYSSPRAPRARASHHRRARKLEHAASNATQVVGSELRAWLRLLDAVLVGVESTAWSVRELADELRDSWQVTEGDLRELGDELDGSSRGLVRLTRTGFVLGQIAASYRMFGLRSAFMSERAGQALLQRLHQRNAERFYTACVEHGGAFLKVGQVLSARPDLLPAPWVGELSRLQDAAPCIGFEAAKAVIERELGMPLTAAFASFDETPLAAASIGQVHTAVSHAGARVAVKVQRPGIAGLVRADLQMLEAFVASMRSSLPELDYASIVAELRSTVTGELDYRAEADNASRVADAFSGDPNVLVPRPVPELCGAALLTTTFVEGRKITDVLDELHAQAQQGDAAAQQELSRILGTLIAAYLKQILIFGTFQADPHPGNLLVTREGQLVILDFGCTKTLSPELKERYGALLRSFMLSDRERTTQLLLELGFATRSGAADTLLQFADALLREFQTALASGQFAWPDKHELGERASRVLRACESDPIVSIPLHFVMIARVLGTLAGLFSHYRPDIAFSEHIMPVLSPVLFPTEPNLTGEPS